jgi:hypothetical protein
LRLGVETLLKVLAVSIYVLGVLALIYVGYVLPYFHPLDPRSELAGNNWGLLCSGLAFLFIGSGAWAAVRTSLEVDNSGENYGDGEDNE